MKKLFIISLFLFVSPLLIAEILIPIKAVRTRTSTSIKLDSIEVYFNNLKFYTDTTTADIDKDEIVSLIDDLDLQVSDDLNDFENFDVKAFFIEKNILVINSNQMTQGISLEIFDFLGRKIFSSSVDLMNGNNYFNVFENVSINEIIFIKLTNQNIFKTIPCITTENLTIANDKKDKFLSDDDQIILVGKNSNLKSDTLKFSYDDFVNINDTLHFELVELGNYNFPNAKLVIENLKVITEKYEKTYYYAHPEGNSESTIIDTSFLNVTVNILYDYKLVGRINCTNIYNTEDTISYCRNYSDGAYMSYYIGKAVIDENVNKISFFELSISGITYGQYNYSSASYGILYKFENLDLLIQEDGTYLGILNKFENNIEYKNSSSSSYSPHNPSYAGYTRHNNVLEYEYIPGTTKIWIELYP